MTCLRLNVTSGRRFLQIGMLPKLAIMKLIRDICMKEEVNIVVACMPRYQSETSI